MNPLEPRLITGTIGELLVQLRLFQYGIQAAPPLKDSGNDLIAVRGSTFKAIQVKTTGIEKAIWQIPRDRQYHVLSLVRLHGENNELYLDETEIYLLSRELIESGEFDLNNLGDHRICQEVVDRFFPP
jgi:hypothetical protein